MADLEHTLFLLPSDQASHSRRVRSHDARRQPETESREQSAIRFSFTNEWLYNPLTMSATLDLWAGAPLMVTYLGKVSNKIEDLVVEKL